MIKNRSAITVTTILAVAQRQFARLGFDAASTRSIAQEAGCNLALIQYHFGGKEGLYTAVVRRCAEQAARRLRVERAHAGADLRCALVRYLAVDAPEFAAIAARGLIAAEPTPLSEFTRAALQPLLETIGLFRGADDPDAETLLATALAAAAAAAAMPSLVSPDRCGPMLEEAIAAFAAPGVPRTDEASPAALPTDAPSEPDIDALPPRRPPKVDDFID